MTRILAALGALFPIVAAFDAPDLKEQFATQGTAPLGSESPEAFARFVRSDSERLGPLIKLAGIKPE